MNIGKCTCIRSDWIRAGVEECTFICGKIGLHCFDLVLAACLARLLSSTVNIAPEFW